MAAFGREADQEWGMLADLEEGERQAKMLQRYNDLADLPEEERGSRLLRMVDAEYALPSQKLRHFTASRISVWLMLAPEVARRISASYDAAMRKRPGLQSTKWVDLANDLARVRSREEQERLVALLPSVFVGLKLGTEKPKRRWWWPF